MDHQANTQAQRKEYSPGNRKHEFEPLAWRVKYFLQAQYLYLLLMKGFFFFSFILETESIQITLG